MSGNSKVLEAITDLTNKIVLIEGRNNDLLTQNTDLLNKIMELLNTQKQSAPKTVEEPLSKLALKKAELEAVQKSSKMKPDAKEKKIEKLNEQIKKLEEKPVKKEKAPAKEKPPQNLSRLTDKIKDSLKDIIGSQFIDSMNTEFKTYVNDMSSDAYAAHDMKVHMENFKRLQTPSGGGGGGEGPMDSMIRLSIEALQELEDTLKRSDDVGIYVKSDGKKVTGPAQNDDEEDIVDKKFDGETFQVDKSTGRVYNEDSDFLGFWRSNGGLI